MNSTRYILGGLFTLALAIVWGVLLAAGCVEMPADRGDWPLEL